jgi:hypothetical protein
MLCGEMKPAKDILVHSPALEKRLKAAALLTSRQEQLLEAAAAIRLAPDEAEAAYMARELVQCTLPHRNPGNAPRWLRRNGASVLVLQAGWDAQKDRSFGYPYGSLPRLLLFWITTEAVQTKRRRLELGRSLSGFMRELGLIPASAGGGKHSDAKRLRGQMERLFRCRISFEQAATDAAGAEGNAWLDMQIAPRGELWWSPKQPEQGTLWGSWIELGEDFFRAITAAPVPVDMRVLRAIKQSPLALDLYAWATWRVFRLRKPAVIPWDGLMKQMGGEYERTRDFARKARAAFRKVRQFYPGLKIAYVKGGLMLHPSPTAIPPATGR